MSAVGDRHNTLRNARVPADAASVAPPPAARSLRRRKQVSGSLAAALDAAESVAGSLLARNESAQHPAGRVSGSEAHSPRPDHGDSPDIALSDGTRIRFTRMTTDDALEPA